VNSDSEHIQKQNNPLARWTESDIPRGGAYDARFRALEKAGHYLHAEADLVMSYAPTSVLDLGCGTGRVAIELAKKGISVVGVDLDEEMIAVAKQKDTSAHFQIDDATTFTLDKQFSVVVMAGNVLCFVAQGTERTVILRASAHLAPGGLLICGYSIRPDTVEIATYDRFANDAGLVPIARYRTWEKDPYVPGGDYVVCVDQRDAEI
jgi:2-polyprenyl-3-methyl-5-hydroxy-6-metoxy-1,4-benzoquinol methylase